MDKFIKALESTVDVECGELALTSEYFIEQIFNGLSDGAKAFYSEVPRGKTELKGGCPTFVGDTIEESNRMYGLCDIDAMFEVGFPISDIIAKAEWRFVDRHFVPKELAGRL